jgi:hypothetical protein
MGLMYLSMANSKTYQQMQTQYHHLCMNGKISLNSQLQPIEK